MSDEVPGVIFRGTDDQQGIALFGASAERDRELRRGVIEMEVAEQFPELLDTPAVHPGVNDAAHPGVETSRCRAAHRAAVAELPGAGASVCTRRTFIAARGPYFVGPIAAIPRRR